MLEKTDLSKSIDEDTFKKEIAPLYPRLGVLQRELWDRRVPIIIVVEGWNASGITMVVSELIQYLDPRGFALHSIGSPNDDERARPLLWRFWTRTPARGRMALFARSWYSRSLAEQVSGIDWRSQIRRSITDINTFERQISDDGAVIIKFFLHISKEEQKKRFSEREKDALTSWMITQGDWDFHSHYDDYLPIIEEYLDGTDTPHAPWTVIGATEGFYTRLKVYSVMIRQLEKRYRESKKRGREKKHRDIRKPPRTRVERVADPPEHYTRGEYESALSRSQDEVRDIQYWLYKRKIPLMIVYEGWDAAGKGGNIMRLVHSMNPRGYDVVPVSRPDQTEADHHYLWRFYRRFPPAGHITIFDRSWYGRVLVERIEGYCAEQEWKRAYREINEMEQSYVEQGGGLVKFWLEISRDEQHRRFMARQNDSLKEWKMTDEDWRNRGKWREYDEAVDEMLARTSTSAAPWTVIESDDKYYARLKALRTVIEYGIHLLR
ncbi:MAG: polyphosphate:AMP phosphotransferase [Methanolinea sp.]|jgi:polyphosphate:AMP phosphotransferase|nr:polyphosphate:AMP phosphotransferase [Methanolinea sp.]